jgi:Na+(H+)/acetate symporter ActP
MSLFLGLILLMTAVLSVQAALGLVFDGRYRDFPFAPLTGAAIPLLMLGTWKRRSNVPAAEKAMAVTLAVSAVYIVGNESVANWQALWFSAGLLALALTLVQARDAPG